MATTCCELRILRIHEMTERLTIEGRKRHYVSIYLSIYLSGCYIINLSFNIPSTSVEPSLSWLYPKTWRAVASFPKVFICVNDVTKKNSTSFPQQFLKLFCYKWAPSVGLIGPNCLSKMLKRDQCDHSYGRSWRWSYRSRMTCYGRSWQSAPQLVSLIKKLVTNNWAYDLVKSWF